MPVEEESTAALLTREEMPAEIARLMELSNAGGDDDPATAAEMDRIRHRVAASLQAQMDKQQQQQQEGSCESTSVPRSNDPSDSYAFDEMKLKGQRRTFGKRVLPAGMYITPSVPRRAPFGKRALNLDFSDVKRTAAAANGGALTPRRPRYTRRVHNLPFSDMQRRAAMLQKADTSAAPKSDSIFSQSNALLRSGYLSIETHRTCGAGAKPAQPQTRIAPPQWNPVVHHAPWTARPSTTTSAGIFASTYRVNFLPYISARPPRFEPPQRKFPMRSREALIYDNCIMEARPRKIPTREERLARFYGTE